MSTTQGNNQQYRSAPSYHELQKKNAELERALKASEDTRKQIEEENKTLKDRMAQQAKELQKLVMAVNQPIEQAKSLMIQSLSMIDSAKITVQVVPPQQEQQQPAKK